jgi:hypothetical protein
MILTQPKDIPPMGQCHIEQKGTGSEATPFSSLAPSNRLAPANEQAVDKHRPHQGDTEAPSKKSAQADEQAVRRHPSCQGYTEYQGLTVHQGYTEHQGHTEYQGYTEAPPPTNWQAPTFASPTVVCGTPGSNRDSEATEWKYCCGFNDGTSQGCKGD